MTYQDIARLIPTIQAATLVSHNYDILKKKKKKKAGDFVGLAATNVVGVGLIQAEADFIG